jgi:hypothetical protein
LSYFDSAPDGRSHAFLGLLVEHNPAPTLLQFLTEIVLFRYHDNHGQQRCFRGHANGAFQKRLSAQLKGLLGSS